MSDLVERLSERAALYDARTAAILREAAAALSRAEATKVELAEHLDKVIALSAAEVERANRAEAQRDALAMALTMAAKTFRKYEQLHRDKGTAEGTTKANSNMIIAQVCERALAAADMSKKDAQAMGEE